MMTWWRNRKALKQAREFLAGVRKLVRMHRDIMEARQIAEITTGCDELRMAIKARDALGAEELVARVDRLLGQALPKGRHSGLRENVEVLLVAVIVAMGVRTFFVQPFKIPTGSMQPTLYGIVEEPNANREASLPVRLVSTLFLGKWPVDESARGINSLLNFVGWMLWGNWPEGARSLMRGDHIFVDRFTYHFRKPQRGEVVVFETSEIPDIPESSRGKFYIKRLIGLGGDRVEIAPPYVKINGQRLDGRQAFQRVYSMRSGYNGYVLPEPGWAKYINMRQPFYDVPAKHLFVLGDNTRSSLDGRFWGSVSERALIGRAVFVYWPFSRRFGRID